MTVEQQIADIRHALGRVEGRLDGIQLGLASSRATQAEILKRVRGLELNRAGIAGAVGVVSAAVTLAAKHLVDTFWRGA